MDKLVGFARKKRLGDLLVDAGVISQDQLVKALQVQKTEKQGERLDVYKRQGQRKCIPSMWDMASLHGNCARTQGLSVWKKQTSAMSHRKISMMCSILLRWMSHLFP